MPKPQHVYWRRRLTVLAGLVGVVGATALLLGNGSSDGEAQRAATDAQEPKPPELPRGGVSVLPEYRVVAFYGAPQSRELGALGICPRWSSSRSSPTRTRATTACIARSSRTR